MLSKITLTSVVYTTNIHLLLHKNIDADTFIIKF